MRKSACIKPEYFFVLFTEHTQEAMLEKPTVEMPGTVVRLSSECPVYRKQLKVR